MKNFFGKLKSFTRNQRLIQKDIYSNQLMINLSSMGKYFPVSGSSLNMHSLATMINDVVINDRKQIVEFGAGLSTLYVARLIHSLNLETRVISIDDNQGWLDLMKDRLEDEGLSPYVQFVFGPLAPCSHAKQGLEWYDEQAVIKALQDCSTPVDSVLVDGPMAFEKSKGLARYPALPVANPFLNDQYAIFLDDMHRDGEQAIIKEWSKLNQLEFRKVNPVFSLAQRGEGFNPVV